VWEPTIVETNRVIWEQRCVEGYGSGNQLFLETKSSSTLAPADLCATVPDIAVAGHILIFLRAHSSS
jgi:hypothetical protein